VEFCQRVDHTKEVNLEQVNNNTLKINIKKDLQVPHVIDRDQYDALLKEEELLIANKEAKDENFKVANTDNFYFHSRYLDLDGDSKALFDRLFPMQ